MKKGNIDNNQSIRNIINSCYFNVFIFIFKTYQLTYNYLQLIYSAYITVIDLKLS